MISIEKGRVIESIEVALGSLSRSRKMDLLWVVGGCAVVLWRFAVDRSS